MSLKIIAYQALGETYHFTSREPLPEYDEDNQEEKGKIERIAEERLQESTT